MYFSQQAEEVDFDPLFNKRWKNKALEGYVVQPGKEKALTHKPGIP